MLERTLFTAMSCVALLALAACTGSADSDHDASTTASATSTTTTTTTGSGGAGSTTAGAGGSGGGGDSAGTGGSGGSGGAAGAPSGYKYGQVFVGSGMLDDIHPHSYEVEAGFVTSLDGTLGVFTSKTVGPCVVKSYSTPLMAGTTKNNASAGVVMVNGGIEPISLVPDATSSYPKVLDKTTDLFSGGETITIDAAGADVPAFSASAIAPSEVDLTSPLQPPNNAPLPVDRTSDLVLTWNDGGAGDILVRFRDGTSTEVACSLPSAPGTGTVPKEALAALGPGSSGEFNILPGSVQTVPAGDWTVEIWVLSSLTWNGVVNPQTFTYQATN